MERRQFTFYRSFYKAVCTLPKNQRLGLLTAVIEYGLDGTEPQALTERQEGQFVLIKPVLDTAWKRAFSGQTGGKISKRTAEKKISKGEKEKETEIETEIETETEDEGFLEFWERYPVKLGRQEALKQWRCVCQNFDQKDIFKGLQAWRNSDSWRRENGRFVPKAEKWLRENWWLQKPKQPVPTGASGVLGEAELEAIQRMLKD